MQSAIHHLYEAIMIITCHGYLFVHSWKGARIVHVMWHPNQAGSPCSSHPNHRYALSGVLH